MKLYADILAHYLSNEDAQIRFPDLQLNAKEIVEMQCYQALRQIKSIIENDALADAECFMKIEEIICALEALGIDHSTRHDFG